MPHANLIEMKEVTKIYDGGVLALHRVDFSVRQGEIHALVGENGAGKSTLMKILFGMEEASSGQLYMDGRPVHFTSSRHALQHGIGMVHQHFMLVDEFTAAENLVLGEEGGAFLCNKEQDADICRELCKQYGFDIVPDRCVRDMSVGMKQKLEILKILYRQAKVIVLDEPTAVLTPQETDELFDRLLELKNQGMTIIFISHKLDEVKKISDRISILRSGEMIGTFDTGEITTEEISRLMVGRAVLFDYSRQPKSSNHELLRVKDLFYRDQFGVMKLCGVSMHVQDSEIVGIAGVEGNGQSELVGLIMALLPHQAGRILFEDQDIAHMSIGDIRSQGISYVPEDRMVNGCAASMSVQENLIASNVDHYSGKAFLLKKKQISENSQRLIEGFKVKTNSEYRAVKSLSGGNIQKVIVAREFSAGSKLLILEQPTRGIDVGSISFIHQKILEMREAGCGILLVSADLNELISLSDRILVMYKGQIVADLDNRDPVDEQELGLYMLGLRRDIESQRRC